MTGTTLAQMQWRALDREGEDKCRLAQLDEGYMLVGHARFRDNGDWAALDYVVRTGADWRMLSADITGLYQGKIVAWKLKRSGGDWTLNDVPQPDIQDAENLDLDFTPATNLLAIKRLPEVGKLDMTAAWFRLPGPELSLLTQTYTRERGNYIHYAAKESDFDAHLAVDDHGFVTKYPDFWEMADHA
jgi:hypothetical protein